MKNTPQDFHIDVRKTQRRKTMFPIVVLLIGIVVVGGMLLETS